MVSPPKKYSRCITHQITTKVVKYGLRTKKLAINFYSAQKNFSIFCQTVSIFSMVGTYILYFFATFCKKIWTLTKSVLLLHSISRAGINPLQRKVDDKCRKRRLAEKGSWNGSSHRNPNGGCSSVG